MIVIAIGFVLGAIATPISDGATVVASIISSVITAPIFAIAVTVMYFDLGGGRAAAEPTVPSSRLRRRLPRPERYRPGLARNVRAGRRELVDAGRAQTVEHDLDVALPVQLRHLAGGPAVTAPSAQIRVGTSSTTASSRIPPTRWALAISCAVRSARPLLTASC